MQDEGGEEGVGVGGVGGGGEGFFFVGFERGCDDCRRGVGEERCSGDGDAAPGLHDR